MAGFGGFGFKLEEIGVQGVGVGGCGNLVYDLCQDALADRNAPEQGILPQIGFQPFKEHQQDSKAPHSRKKAGERVGGFYGL